MDASERIKRMTNCRLKRTYQETQKLLAMLEEEMEARMGKGGGGLR